MSAGWNRIIGHQKVALFLQRSLELGRTAHAYLLVGPPRIGKGTLAQIIAQAFNCLDSKPPCGQCSQCLRVQSGKHPDITIIGITPATEGRTSPKEIAIEQVRAIGRSASLKPFEGKTRVFIIDGAERLSGEASNALLKTLEEPPPQTILILLTNEVEAILPTIRSRCQTFTLSPVPDSEIEKALISRFNIEEKQADFLAHLARGRAGWALEAASNKKLLTQYQETLEQLTAVHDASISECLAFAQELAGMYYKDKASLKELLETWQIWWRDTLLSKLDLSELLLNQDRAELIAQEGKSLDYQQILDFVTRLQSAWEKMEWNANPRMVLDLLLLSMPKPMVG